MFIYCEMLINARHLNPRVSFVLSEIYNRDKNVINTLDPNIFRFLIHHKYLPMVL